MKLILPAIRLLIALTILTGVAYPVAVTGIGRVMFPKAASGSLIKREGRVIGSELLAQKTESPRYFWPRASAADHATVPSGASNQGPASKALEAAVRERRVKFGEDAPADLLTASGSGLDPHITPEAAMQQAPRIATARQITLERVAGLIDGSTLPSQFGVLGEPRVNVLQLNLSLDAAAK